MKSGFIERIRSKHNKSARFNHLYFRINRKRFQFLIFGTRIKNDPVWPAFQQIIIIQKLMGWIEIECNRMKINA